MQTLLPDQTDVIDRAARLEGHVTVDNASIPVTGTFWQTTQPVSGTLTANIGTTNGVALDATLTGGTQKAIPRGAAKGTTAAGDVTSAAVDANTQAMHVQLAGTQPSVPVTGTFWQATQPISGTLTGNQGTANTAANAWPAKITDGVSVAAVKAATTVVTRSDPALVIQQSPMYAECYCSSTNGTVAIPVTASTTTSLAYLFHPSTETTYRYEIYRIEISVEGPTTASTAGQVTTLRLGSISAEAATPGGTSQVIQVFEGGQHSSIGIFRTGATGAPTSRSSAFATWQLQTVATNQHQVFVWDCQVNNLGHPLTNRVSVGGGYEITAVTNGTAIGAALNVAITFFWREV